MAKDAFSFQKVTITNNQKKLDFCITYSIHFHAWLGLSDKGRAHSQALHKQNLVQRYTTIRSNNLDPSGFKRI